MNQHSHFLVTLPSRHHVGLILALAGLISAATLVLSPARLASTQAVVGSWSYTGNLNTARSGHTATLLPSGKVLVAGGTTSDDALDSAELYDPATGTWGISGSLKTGRVDHTATLLPNGMVLVAGGYDYDYDSQNSAELYDPATGTWSFTGNLNTARIGGTATLLPNGKVLVAGGYPNEAADAIALSIAELYDPTTRTWSSTGNLNTARVAHTATLLPSGKVLVAAGIGNCTSQRWCLLNSAELYDPATGTWSSIANLSASRFAHTATLLPNGKVLVGGGDGNCTSQRCFALNSAELYDPATATWSITASPNRTRWGPATLLANGKVLVVGGAGNSELFDSGTPNVASVSAASYAAHRAVAPQSIATAFGANLATDTQTAPSLPLPTQLAGVSVRVRDSANTERLAPLFFASPGQINYQVPPGTAAGLATVTVTSGDGNESSRLIVAAGLVEIAEVAPGLFTANSDGQGVAAAIAQHVSADGGQSFEFVGVYDPAQQKYLTRPIDLGPDSEVVALVLFGTGLRERSALSAVTVHIGGISSEVLFADAAPGFVGLDQVNVLLPRSLVGRGEVDVVLSVDGQAANRVRVSIR